MTLQEQFERRGPIKKIGVIGMGYVGIPAAALFADCDNYEKVLGFQRDSNSSGYKINMLNRGESPLKGEEPGLEELLGKTTKQGKFECTPDFSRISEMDAVTLAIQTPFLDPKSLSPDFSALSEGLKNVGKYLNKGMLIVLESTITPGTTEGLAKDILEKESEFIAGKDFGLAHAPERVMVGRLLQNIREHDRIVGGIDKDSTMRAIELYSPILTKGKIIPMSAKAAEVTKTAENTFRDLQIAAANQLALYCEAMGINFYDVRAGIDSLKGEGITRAILWPGAGVGGHCLTKDTYHLERGVEGRTTLDYPDNTESLYVLARKINDFMPQHMYRLTCEALSQVGKTIKDSKVTILGWAFINDSDDARNTPSEKYFELLKEAGCKDISIHDPFVKSYPNIDINNSLNMALYKTDCIVIFTGHKQYNILSPEKIFELTGKNYPVIVDGRNIINTEEFINKGHIVKSIGRGDI